MSALWIIIVCFRRQRLRKKFLIRAILIKGIFGKSLLRQFAMYRASLCLLLTFLQDQLEQRREKYRLLSDAGGHVTAAIFSTAPAPRAAVANRNMLSGANCSLDLLSSELLNVTDLCYGFGLLSQTSCLHSSPLSFAQLSGC